MRIAELAGRRVAVWGCGGEGLAAVAALRQRLPALQPSVFCTPAEAQILRERWPGFAGNLVHSSPDADALAAFDVVIKSPGISLWRTEIQQAQQRGTAFTSGTSLWFAEHPHARVIAVTGTKGKSTTSALIAHLLRGLGRRVALAGNIGVPLLELLDPVEAPAWWVIELSSFQTRDAAALDIAVIVNVEEEHLDWHGSRARYLDDKLSLATQARALLLNASHTELRARLGAHPQTSLFGMDDGWHVVDGDIWRGGVAVLGGDELPLPGAHNALNACAALAALELAGEDALAAAVHLRSFRPLPHRLQQLGHYGQLHWIDDSIATTPAAVLQALASLPAGPVSLILGGYERGLDWQSFAQTMRDQPPHAIILNGANAERVEQCLRSAGGDYQVCRVTDLAAAVATARALTPAGGMVLLSPGAPSFDQFHDYAERGRQFAELAGFDSALIGSIQGLGIA